MTLQVEQFLYFFCKLLQNLQKNNSRTLSKKKKKGGRRETANKPGGLCKRKLLNPAPHFLSHPRVKKKTFNCSRPIPFNQSRLRSIEGVSFPPLSGFSPPRFPSRATAAASNPRPQSVNIVFARPSRRMRTAGVRYPAFREPETDERGGHLECGTEKPPRRGEDLRPVVEPGPRERDVGAGEAATAWDAARKAARLADGANWYLRQGLPAPS